MDQKIDNHPEIGFVEKYIGGNEINNNYYSMYKESEREFVVTHNANIKPTTYFTGRETELQELRQRIEEGRKSVLVSGMGGIGKTHICRKLFEEYSTRNGKGKNVPFKHIGYIEYDGDMNSSLQNCLKFRKQAQQEDNQEAAWKELEYLASGGKLLLFVDNVNVSIGEDPNLKRLMSIPGAVILTSRRRVFSKEFEPYRIGFLSTGKCREIYERIRYEGGKKRVSEEEVPHLEYIIDTLVARHTITIEFLAHLAWTKNWTVQDLWVALDKNKFQLEYKDEEDKLVNIQKEYEKLYDLSELSGEEQNILEAFSVFPYIPLAAETCNEWLLADAGVNKDDDILMGLYRKGWLQFDMEQGGYSMHPVFAQFIYEKCKPSQDNHHGLIKACQRYLEILESGSVLECQKYIPFAENIIEKVEMREDMSRAAFIDILVKLLKYRAEYEKAEKWYKKFLDIYVMVYGEDHPYTVDSYMNLAEIYMCIGEYEKMQELCDKCINISLTMFGVELEKNGIEYKKGDKFDIVYKNMQLSEKTEGQGYSSFGVLMARIYEKNGEYDKAEELYEKKLLIDRKVYGEEHQTTAESYDRLAEFFEKRKEYDKAKDLYKKSILIRKSILGENHLEVGKGYENLARINKQSGEYKDAIEMIERALRINKIRLGEDHPSIADNYDTLAELYQTQEEYGRAKDLYEKCIHIREKKGYQENFTIIIYLKLSDLYIMQGDYEKAEKILKKVLRIKKESQGQCPLKIERIQLSFKHIFEKKEFDDSGRKILQDMESELGENHLYVADFCKKNAHMYEQYKNESSTLFFYIKLYKIYIVQFGYNHLNTQTVYGKMKEVYEKWNPEGNYEQWLEERMRVIRKSLFRVIRNEISR